MKKLLFGVLLTLSWGSILQGQVTTPFKVRYQKVVDGDVAMISNQIVNRADAKISPNDPYQNRTNQSKNNDEFLMKYIDVDKDASTFSSSSADLWLDNPENKKIVYAGLYWSATYVYNTGSSPKTNQFVPIDASRDRIDQVKIKLPNQSDYQDIKGQVLFDGIQNKEWKETAPYVVYADVTKLLQSQNQINGTYTIANVRATNGRISGGVAGGWSLFVVYQDTNASAKFITTYDGFVGVTKKAVDIPFSGFPMLPEGEIKAKIAGAALEGDLNLKGDQILFKTDQSKDFEELYNTVREKNNFFNSTITTDDAIMEKRTPNSKNTLGYDAFLMQINNDNNRLITNQTKEATLRMKTFGDRYYMFFNAFSIEVIKPESDEQMPLLLASAGIQLPKWEVQMAEVALQPIKVPLQVKSVKPEKIVPEQESAVASATPTRQQLLAQRVKAISATPKPAPKDYAVDARVTPIESPAVPVGTMDNGYYIIANVFAIHSNATRFVAKLKAMGIDANYFINPKNNYRYVYVSQHNDFASATSMYFSNIQGKYFGELWVMTVTKSEQEAFVSTQTKVPMLQAASLQTATAQATIRKDFYLKC